jgi:alpha-mannosidase
VIPLAWDLNVPLILGTSKSNQGRIINLTSTDIAVDAIKKSEDGEDLIIRVHEMHGGQAKLDLSFEVPISGGAGTDLMERPPGDYIDSGRIIKKLRPFEIAAFRVRL